MIVELLFELDDGLVFELIMIWCNPGNIDGLLVDNFDVNNVGWMDDLVGFMDGD